MALVVTGLTGTMLLAPSAAAAPQCTKTGPTTTQCETPGHTQITTSPPASRNDPWWPYGGFVVALPW
ncbi:hypothetical protein [Mycolicibacterium sp. 050158]|uniref:hypothetical protein n=1 Tax=Mycolicibacterium sp. 050158 TaxID=3090602 RepID=UPI00299DF319|nr:hypothetical protein [Mycolicibacterium sp. 050158]MDX1890244.1 hypothetical protein [Mycolicibacterium sp. 050158]